MTPTQPTAEQLEVTQGFVDAKEEYAAFCIWAKNNLPFMDTPSATSYLFSAWMGSARHRQATEAHIAAAVEAERERCADLADNHSFALDIDDWMKMTKKEISAYACRSVAAAIRSQSNEQE